MRTIVLTFTVFAVIAISMLMLNQYVGRGTADASEQATQEVCFFSHEQTSGMNKICYYDCMSGTAAITVSSISLCPLSITR